MKCKHDEPCVECLKERILELEDLLGRANNMVAEARVERDRYLKTFDEILSIIKYGYSSEWIVKAIDKARRGE